MSEFREKNIETIVAVETMIDVEKIACEVLQLSSQELFRNGNTVRIEHAGQTYWLRLTRGNKLILTK